MLMVKLSKLLSSQGEIIFFHILFLQYYTQVVDIWNKIQYTMILTTGDDVATPLKTTHISLQRHGIN